MITTQVTWADGSPTPESRQLLLDKLQGYPEPIDEVITAEDNVRLVIRSWTDLAAAQEWVDFVNQHGAKSAVIVTE